MKKTCGTRLAEHGLTLLTGTLLGATVTAGVTYQSSINLWQTVGSLSAGFGTIGLMSLGWMARKDWGRQKKAELLISSSKELIHETSQLSSFIKLHLINHPNTVQAMNDRGCYLKSASPYTLADFLIEVKRLLDSIDTCAVAIYAFPEITSDEDIGSRVQKLRSYHLKMYKTHRHLHDKHKATGESIDCTDLLTGNEDLCIESRMLHSEILKSSISF